MRETKYAMNLNENMNARINCAMTGIKLNA